MRAALWMLVAVTALACAAGAGATGGAAVANDVATRVAWDEQSFEPVRVRVLESDPPRFVLVWSREMPTPGYALRVDSVAVDDEAGRIVARISELAPSGMVAQVITRTELSIEVGPLPAGRYVVEVRSRKGDKGAYRAAGAGVLVAGGGGQPRR